MTLKLNDVQARAYIAGDQSLLLEQFERKHILRLVKSLQAAANRPFVNFANLYKTADRYVKNHQDTINTKELSTLIAMRDYIKTRII